MSERTSAESPQPAANSYPRTFGPYILLRRLGGGGMGDVFEAKHPQRGRREALKLLRAGLDDDPSSVERFLREIRALSRVTHDDIVRLLDSGTVEGMAYYTMPLLPGPSLDKIIDEVRAAGEPVPGPLANQVLDRHGVQPAASPSGDSRADFAHRIAALLSGVARALGALHAAGIFHRDVKPSNLMLDERRRAVLTDFGLARLDASRLTQTNEAVGTPAYMAPEQLQPGASVDARVDVYGLGAALFELLTLRRPYEGKTVAEAVALILEGRRLRTHEAAPWLPDEIAVVLGRCLERLPGDRYSDMESLARDLDACVRGEPIAARPVPDSVRLGREVARRRWHIGIAAALLLVVGVAAYMLPGRIAVRAVLDARVILDGKEIGTTPLLDYGVAAGTYRIELRREGFHPRVRTIRVARLGTYDWDAEALVAIEPAGGEALRTVSAALGIELATVDLKANRSGDDIPAVVTLSPRGLVREAPRELRLWSDGVAEGVRVRLQGPGETVAEWTPEAFLKEQVLAIPPDAGSRFRPGAEYVVEVADAEGKEISSAPFRVATEPEARSSRDELAALARRFEKGDAMSEMIATEHLIGHGFWSEALARVRDLEARLGPRPEIARMGLAALDRAGLRDAAFWVDWADALQGG